MFEGLKFYECQRCEVCEGAGIIACSPDDIMQGIVDEPMECPHCEGKGELKIWIK